MFDGEIGANPGGGDDEGLEEELRVLHQGEMGHKQGRGEHIRADRLEEEQKEPDGGAAQIAEKEHGKDGVGADGVLGAEFVAAEKDRRNERGGDPGH